VGSSSLGLRSRIHRVIRTLEPFFAHCYAVGFQDQRKSPSRKNQREALCVTENRMRMRNHSQNHFSLWDTTMVLPRLSDPRAGFGLFFPIRRLRTLISESGRGQNGQKITAFLLGRVKSTRLESSSVPQPFGSDMRRKVRQGDVQGSGFTRYEPTTHKSGDYRAFRLQITTEGIIEIFAQ
jgi:hypothetical protein